MEFIDDNPQKRTARKKIELRNLLQVNLAVRGFAILLVLAAHIAIAFVVAEANLNPKEGLTEVFFGCWQLVSPENFIVLELARVSVPLFLFFAGYHMARSPRSWKTIWNNSKNLLLPMLFWSIIAWGLSWRKGADGWSFEQFLSLFLSGRTQLGYYFLILIVQFFIISRYIVPFIEKKPVLGITGAISLQFIIHCYDYIVLLDRLQIISFFQGTNDFDTFPEFLFPRFIVYFTIGVWASLNLSSFKAITEKWFNLLILLALIGAVILILETGLIYHFSIATLQNSAFFAASNAWGEWKISTALWSIAGIYFILALARRWLPIKIKLEKYGKYSYQLLILHGMVINFLQILCYKYLPKIHWYGVIGFFVWFFITLYMSMIVIELTKKCVNRWGQKIILGL